MIRDHKIKDDCEIKFIDIITQLTNLFTKPLAREKFNYLRTKRDILDYSYLYKKILFQSLYV